MQGNLETENRILAHGRVIQLFIQHRIDHGSCVGNGDALTHTVGPSGPARVDQPHGRAMFFETLPQKLRIAIRMQRHERSAIAGTEYRRGLGHSLLGAGNPGGITGNEMIHGLGCGKPGNRWQHTKGIGGKKQDFLWMTARTFQGGIGNGGDMIGAAGILRERTVMQIQTAGSGVHGHVFQYRTEAHGGAVDLRLVLR